MLKLLVALSLAVAALVAADLTYPECSSTGTGCCDFGTGSMRNRGYVVMEIDDEDLIVTCKNGTLLCATGNPGNTAVAEARENVDCPDFETIMESRSTVTYLEGVAATTTTTTTDDESGPGTVTAADD